MSKSRKQTKNKKKKILWIVLITTLIAVVVSGGIWYNYIYNPVIDFKSSVYEVVYSYCLDNNYSKQVGILRVPYCECVAKDLGANIKNHVSRYQEAQKQLDVASQKCLETTKFSTVSNAILKEQYNNTCIKGFGAHQKKYCDCFANNVVYFIRQYSYESAIKLHLDDIMKKATDSCFGHYLKADKRV